MYPTCSEVHNRAGAAEAGAMITVKEKGDLDLGLHLSRASKTTAGACTGSMMETAQASNCSRNKLRVQHRFLLASVLPSSGMKVSGLGEEKTQTKGTKPLRPGPQGFSSSKLGSSSVQFSSIVSDSL